MERIYLDFAAATPVAEEVKKAMEPYFSEKYGNAGSLHVFGQEAHAALDRARDNIAKEFGASFRGVVFTSSATEANNWVLRGAVKTFLQAGKKGRAKIIISSIEHESIEETAADLESEGVEVVRIPVSELGIVDVHKLEESLDERTVIVSIIYGSNVVGTVQPIPEIASIVQAFRAQRGSLYPLFHTDAVQAAQFQKIAIQELGVDALTLSSQKIYGPKGAGALVLREETARCLAPLVTGGAQEFGLRAGTENIPAIVGFGKAVELAAQCRDAEAKRVAELRDYFWQELQRAVPNVLLNGSETHRLPNNLHVSFVGRDNQELLIQLDQVGIAASIGSACSVRARTASRVVLALGVGEERATNCIRFTLGRQTTKEVIDTALSRIVQLLTL